MIKYCKEKWAKNENTLRDALLKHKGIDDCEYKDIVKLAVENILNDDDDDYDWDVENITEIDNGDYQGTLLYLIPLKTYQPSEDEYLMTYVGYGSCSGCDTLQSIQYGSTDENKINDYVKLCRDIICNTIKPYNKGWRKESIFDDVEDIEV